MDFLMSNLLTLILFTPVLGCGCDRASAARAGQPDPLDGLHFEFCAVWPFTGLVVEFRPAQAGFQFEQKVTWYAAINSSFHVGVDGISLSMVLLTTLLTPLAILASFSIKDRVKSYMVLFLLLELGMLGVFMSLDLLLFFVFWEFGLVPMYFLINQWGSEKGEREIWGGRKIPARAYASFKFMIYTMAGSLGLLLAIQMIGVVSGTFDLIELFAKLDNAERYAVWAASRYGQNSRLLGFRHRFRHQSSCLAFPYLAAGCAHRGAHRRIDDPGGCAAQAGRIWLLAPGAAALPGRSRSSTPGRWLSWR